MRSLVVFTSDLRCSAEQRAETLEARTVFLFFLFLCFFSRGVGTAGGGRGGGSGRGRYSGSHRVSDVDTVERGHQGLYSGSIRRYTSGLQDLTDSSFTNFILSTM